MMTHLLRRSFRRVLVAVCFCFAPMLAVSQPAPAPSAAPKLNGNWTLNRDQSDDPREKLKPESSQDERRSRRDDRRDNGSPDPTRRRSGIPGIGIPSIGGGRRSGGNRQDSAQDARAKQAGELADALQPSSALMIIRNDPEIDITNTESVRQLFTDGRKLESAPAGASRTQAQARWEQDSLVSEESGPAGEKIVRAYRISEDGKQLVETVTVTPKNASGPVTLRYCYDKVAE